MQVQKQVIAKKYAIAFLHVYFDQINDKTINKIFTIEDFLKKNRLFYFYLDIPTISSFVKQKALTRIAQYFKLNKPIKRLMFLLLEQGRIEILDTVLNLIIYYYRFFHNVQLFKITSSHKLIDSEKTIIINFITSIAKGGVVSQFEIDKKLICGLRIQSSTFLWERSIAKQLRDVKRSIFKQVGLW